MGSQAGTAIPAPRLDGATENKAGKMVKSTTNKMLVVWLIAVVAGAGAEASDPLDSQPGSRHFPSSGVF